MKAQVQAPRALHPGLHTGHWTLNLGLSKNNNNYSGTRHPPKERIKLSLPPPKQNQPSRATF